MSLGGLLFRGAYFWNYMVSCELYSISIFMHINKLSGCKHDQVWCVLLSLIFAAERPKGASSNIIRI